MDGIELIWWMVFLIEGVGTLGIAAIIILIAAIAAFLVIVGDYFAQYIMRIIRNHMP